MMKVCQHRIKERAYSKNWSIDRIQKYLQDPSGEVSSLQALILLYTRENKEEVYQYLQKCRLNPSFESTSISRNDLTFYSPQLINYFVFHEEMLNVFRQKIQIQENLSSFISNACLVDFFFAHSVYFAMHSLSAIVQKNEVIHFVKVNVFLTQLVNKLAEAYQDKILLASPLFLQQNSRQHQQPPNQQKMDVIEKYGTAFFDSSDMKEKIAPHDILLRNYKSIFRAEQEEQKYQESYLSTIQFWEDLIQISERLSLADPKIISLRADINKLNEKLPASVYIPFVKGQEAKVFSTKERAPFYICIEIFRPEEEQVSIVQKEISVPIKVFFQNVDIQLSKAITTHNGQEFLRRNSDISSQSIHTEKGQFGIQAFSYQQNNLQLNQDEKEIELKLKSSSSKEQELKKIEDLDPNGISIFYEKKEKSIDSDNVDHQFDSPNTSNHLENPLQGQHRISELQQNSEFPIQKFSKKSMRKIKEMDKSQFEKGIFGEDSQDQTERIRSKSPYGQFHSWKLVHLIIKSGDNLKQEQFALQLISQFEQIFKMEGLPLLLTPYEIVSIGPSSGIIEMIKDASTIDSLKSKQKIQGGVQGHTAQFTKQFLQHLFLRECKKSLSKLLQQVKASYFLLLKSCCLLSDRHNGNILLHKNGKIIHIDFGFFLSIAPGKGLEFEKHVPFKMMTEYIEVLGGIKSSVFNHFRKLFYKGFQAAQKHQDKILLLVKMMYSGHGYTLPCFEKGEQSIDDLELRFNPPGELYSFAQSLINDSLDNWRAKWYDKFQYYFQGIFY